jgi:hypothetical protein
MRKGSIAFSVLFLALLRIGIQPYPGLFAQTAQAKDIKVKITVDGKVLTATLTC